MVRGRGAVKAVVFLLAAQAVEPWAAREVLDRFEHEPDVRAVQAMAAEYANASPDVVDRWLRASRQAYFLPKLDLEYQKGLNASDDYVYDSAARSTLTDTNLDDNDAYQVQLEWRLDKLVMSSERIRVIDQAQDLVKLRDRVLEEVTRLYFDRRELQVAMLLEPANTLEGRVAAELELQELTAHLDALTGGRFSATRR
jgi:hypothetical protein